jgi:hypothetical protein
MTYKLEAGRLIVLTTFDKRKVRCATLTHISTDSDLWHPADSDDLAHEIIAALNLREQLRNLPPTTKKNANIVLNSLVSQAKQNARMVS